ncbi:MAG: LysE family transporter [Lentisphaerae bacterium]|nr:LysE family transporter [Lentisphaerota bacterium]
MSTAATAAAPSAGLGRTFVLSWLIAFTGAVTPGPMLALVIGQVLAQGFAAVFLILLGHALLELLMVGGFALGLAAPLRRPRVRGALAVLGGLALAWMGLMILRDARHASLAASAASALSWPLLVAAGAGVSLSNPYFTGWWATVGTGQMATFGLRRRWPLRCSAPG